MPMTYDEVQPDTRVICHSRGGIKGTVLRKFMGGTGNTEQLVYIDFDEGGPAYNTPGQISPLDEPAPRPKLSRTHKGSSTFWLGGNEYEVFNMIDRSDVRGFWACVRRTHDGTAHTSDDYVVTGASTRRAAFETALGKLKARQVARATDVELLPVIVTDRPADEEHTPLTVDPAAARIVRAREVRNGDTVLAAFSKQGRGMDTSEYFHDQYEAHPVPYDPTHGCGSCETLADHKGAVVNLGDDNPWEVCDPHPADALLLVVPARRD